MSTAKSIKSNFIFNAIKTGGGTLFPLITFPYIARILSPEGLGKYNFAATIVLYFALVATFGLTIYGTREIAKAGDDIGKRSKTAQELFIIHSVVTIIVYLLFIASILLIPKLRESFNLLAIMSVAIILPLIGVEWLYQGLEEYRYISIRSLLFQVLSLIGIFLFVKHESDYIIYAFLIIVAGGSWIQGGFGNLINLIHSRKFVSLKIIRGYEFKKHLKPLLTFFILNVIGSIYVNIDTVMLGFLTTDRSVGLYAGAVKIAKGILPVISTASFVLLPRSSYYFLNNMHAEFGQLIRKGIDYIIVTSLPLAVGIFCASNELVSLFCGAKFMESVNTVRILSPIIVFIPFSVLLTVQILSATGKEKSILVPFTLGAIINIILNYLLIPAYLHNGSAVAYVITEFFVMAFLLYLSRQFIKASFFIRTQIPVVIGCAFIFLICGLLRDSLGGNLHRLAIISVLSCTAYALSLFLFKHYLFMAMLNKARHKFFGNSPENKR